MDQCRVHPSDAKVEATQNPLLLFVSGPPKGRALYYKKTHPEKNLGAFFLCSSMIFSQYLWPPNRTSPWVSFPFQLFQNHLIRRAEGILINLLYGDPTDIVVLQKLGCPLLNGGVE